MQKGEAQPVLSCHGKEMISQMSMVIGPINFSLARTVVRRLQCSPNSVRLAVFNVSRTFDFAVGLVGIEISVLM
jgi:hypothetical protein